MIMLFAGLRVILSALRTDVLGGRNALAVSRKEKRVGWFAIPTYPLYKEKPEGFLKPKCHEIALELLTSQASFHSQ
jgi:hypothetical protein